MNKYFLIALFGLLSVNHVARAENVYIPYLGIDAIFNKAKAQNLRPQYYGANINLGTSYNPYFGTEIFYQQVGSETKKLSNTEKYKTSYRAYGLDLFAYSPELLKFKAFATAGAGFYVLKEKTLLTGRTTDEGYGYRFGGGLIYQISSHVALRAAARYVNFDHISNADHMAEYTFGLRYNFVKD